MSENPPLKTYYAHFPTVAFVAAVDRGLRVHLATDLRILRRVYRTSTYVKNANCVIVNRRQMAWPKAGIAVVVIKATRKYLAPQALKLSRQSQVNYTGSNKSLSVRPSTQQGGNQKCSSSTGALESQLQKIRNILAIQSVASSLSAVDDGL